MNPTRIVEFGTQGLSPAEVDAFVAFTRLMLATLRANAGKGGWQDDSAAALMTRMMEESEELVVAIRRAD